ncbi:unnamed protein product [Effrenium voratum]|uniref:Uncharacterized protein n=1 Tax=Effrenium voratum TaxID=2562239 RepID=A0AA36MKA4_9DINO|nr:unnamed protein product [Effrenium voratum]
MIQLRWLAAGLAALLLLCYSLRSARPLEALPLEVLGPKLQSQAAAALRACEQPLPDSDCTSENQPDPPFAAPTPGARARLRFDDTMEYQLFLPASWSQRSSEKYPVVVFLHGAGDGKFSVMNSQSLPRLLSRNQSTCFDDRECWCLDSEYQRATAMKEASGSEAFLAEEEDLWSPMASCDFAQRFEAIAVMPQGWTLTRSPGGWDSERLGKVEALTRFVLRQYSGDPARVSLTGQSAGGGGAWRFAATRPRLWATVSVVCAPTSPAVAERLEGLPIWVIGWTGDGEMGSDEVVKALKRRRSGATRYTRYTKAPPPPDPLYRDMVGHGSYDLIYRDPRLWQWALAHSRPSAAQEWQK